MTHEKAKSLIAKYLLSKETGELARQVEALLRKYAANPNNTIGNAKK